MSHRSVCVILCACAHATTFCTCDSVNFCVCARVPDHVSMGVGGERLYVCVCVFMWAGGGKYRGGHNYENEHFMRLIAQNSINGIGDLTRTPNWCEQLKTSVWPTRKSMFRGCCNRV